MKKLLSILFFLGIISSSKAIDFTVGGINYTTLGMSTAMVVKGNYSGDVTIPSSVTYSSYTYSIISIGFKAFYGCTGLTSITIPSSITTLADQVFEGCSGLISISIPSSVSTIPYSTFWGCSGLTSINIPSSVTAIKDYAFSGCTGLTSITIPSSVTTISSNSFWDCSATFTVDSNNSNYSSIDGALYNKNQTELIKCPISVTGSFTVPSSVRTIGNVAFYGCLGLTSIIIPISVQEINSNAFKNCTGLIIFNPYNYNYSSKDGVLYNAGRYTLIHCPISISGSIIIPTSVTSIEGRAFWGCTELTSITIPSSVATIRGYAFSECTGLTSFISNLSNPLNLDTSVFSGVNKSTCTLYVPLGTIPLYQAANGWKDFINIIEIGAVTTGIQNIDVKPIEIYPTVTQSHIRVNFDENSINNNLMIFNSLGQKVYESLVTNNQFELDVSNYPVGIYYVQTSGEKNQMKGLGKFVKK